MRGRRASHALRSMVHDGKVRAAHSSPSAAAGQGRSDVELDFDEIRDLVGGLPASATTSRQWWANSSHTQALAWRAAGFHVEQVYLDRERVRFELGPRGGTLHDNHTEATGPKPESVAPTPADPVPVGAPVDVRVVLQWSDAARVILDTAGKPVFPPQPASPGLYRLTFIDGALGRSTVYIGETKNLRRRLSGNYRNPGPRQHTSLRINALLRHHLGADGAVLLATVIRCDLFRDGQRSDLDLTRKGGRLLAENAALLSERLAATSDIANLG
jgi:hypothetical protein